MGTPGPAPKTTPSAGPVTPAPTASCSSCNNGLMCNYSDGSQQSMGSVDPSQSVPPGFVAVGSGPVSPGSPVQQLLYAVGMQFGVNQHFRLP